MFSAMGARARPVVANIARRDVSAWPLRSLAHPGPIALPFQQLDGNIVFEALHHLGISAGVRQQIDIAARYPALERNDVMGG